MNYDIIINNSIIITPYKNRFLNYMENNKKLINVHFKTLEEYIKEIMFDYDEKTIYYVMKKYNIKYYAALSYINSLYLVQEEIEDENVKFLINLKNELIDNNLLKMNNIKYKNVIVFGYDYIDRYYKKLLGEDIKYYNYQYKDNEINAAYQLDNIYEEVNFVAQKICELIKSGIDINKIKLANVNDEYENIIRMVFKMYNIPIYDIKVSLYELPIIKKYLENMDISFIDNQDEIYIKLVKVLNKYAWIDNKEEVKDLIIEDLKKEYINKKYKNIVEKTSLYNIEDEYVFLMNYHSSTFPSYEEDKEFLSNNIKVLLGHDDIKIKNQAIKEQTKKILKSIDHLTITCNKQNFISTLFDNIELLDYEKRYIYSNKINNLELGKMLDNYYKYGYTTDNISKLYPKYGRNYKSYNNKYTKLSKVDRDIINLSYTKMDTYYKCAFKYYIENILKLNNYEETFKIFIGNLSHYILSICFTDEFNYEEEYKKYIENSNKTFSKKEKFFLNKIKEELKFVINTIKEQNDDISFNSVLYEKKIVIKENNNIFEGIIDKLLYDDNDMAIIDYKTGTADINMKYIKYGIGMQLPVYLYLSKNYFKNKNIAGFYLQHILNNETVIEDDYEQQKKSNLKLQGYSNSDYEILKKIDKNYMDSNIIKSLKITSKGFSAYSKVINNEQINELITLTKTKIDECFKEIRNLNFDINPKSIDNINVSCKYCPYKDICYRKDNDIITIESGE